MPRCIPLHKDLDKQLHQAVFDTVGTYELPELPISDEGWSSLTTENASAHEFQGDALLYAFTSQELRRLYPEESSRCYSHIRGALITNQTLKGLMFAYGFTELKFEENTAANAFEMVNSLLFEDQGRDAYDKWARSAFGPLIEAAYEAYCARKEEAHWAGEPVKQKPVGKARSLCLAMKGRKGQLIDRTMVKLNIRSNSEMKKEKKKLRKAIRKQQELNQWLE